MRLFGRASQSTGAAVPQVVSAARSGDQDVNTERQFYEKVRHTVFDLKQIVAREVNCRVEQWKQDEVKYHDLLNRVTLMEARQENFGDSLCTNMQSTLRANGECKEMVSALEALMPEYIRNRLKSERSESALPTPDGGSLDWLTAWFPGSPALVTLDKFNDMAREVVTLDKFNDMARDVRAVRNEVKDIHDTDAKSISCEIAELHQAIKVQRQGIDSELRALRHEFNDLRDLTSESHPIESFLGSGLEVHTPSQGACSATFLPQPVQTEFAVGVIQVTDLDDQDVQASLQAQHGFQVEPPTLEEEWSATTPAASSMSERADLPEVGVVHSQVHQAEAFPDPWPSQPQGFSATAQQPFFTTPPHPTDTHSRAITLALEKDILGALQRQASPEEKRKLVLRKMPLRVHPDKGGSDDAYQWLEKWKEAHFDWFLSDKK